MSIKSIILIAAAVAFLLFYLWGLRFKFKYGYAKLWTGVRKRPNKVPVDPATGKVLRVGDKVKIMEWEGVFIFRDALDNKRCICRNGQTGEIVEATLDDVYFQKKKTVQSLPDDQKKDLRVCIYYPEDFGFKNMVSRGRIGGGSNRVKNDIFYLLEKYAPQYHVLLGKTSSSLENYFFYNDLHMSLRSGSEPKDLEMDEYDDDLCYGKDADGTPNRADLLIVVGDDSSAQNYISTAKKHNIETLVVE